MVSYLIETNILWCYLVKNSKHHNVVVKFLNPLIMDLINSFYVNEFILIELLHLLIKQAKGGFDIAKKLLDQNIPFLHISFDILTISDIKKILKILNKYGHSTSIGGRDSSILVTMQLHNIKNIITHDDGFRQIPDIIIHDPILDNSTPHH